MRYRVFVAGALLAASLPLGAAQAGHCNNIFLFSYNTVPGTQDPLDSNRRAGTITLFSGAIGCLIVGEDIPETPGDDSDTDYIYPASDTFVVRWIGGALPLAGTLTFAGQTHTLEFYETTNGLTNVIDSKQIFVDPASTLVGGQAVANVCPDEDPANCESRTFRTLA